METIVCKNYDEMSLRSAEIIAETVQKKPNCVLGLATGSTPIGLYRNLALFCKNGLSFADVRTVNLDEYYPIDPSNPQSYRYFMNENLFSHINIDKSNTFVPNGLAKDPIAEGNRYEALIQSLGGIDIQVLGVGQNGHIGFNEPADALDLSTHLTDLTPSTVKANARFFSSEKEVPKQAFTMGIGSIMKAEKIILLATGKEKAQAIHALTGGKLDPHCPVTFLNLHPNVVFLCTEDCLNGKEKK